MASRNRVGQGLAAAALLACALSLETVAPAAADPPGRGGEHRREWDKESEKRQAKLAKEQDKREFKLQKERDKREFELQKERNKREFELEKERLKRQHEREKESSHAAYHRWGYSPSGYHRSGSNHQPQVRVRSAYRRVDDLDQDGVPNWRDRDMDGDGVPNSRDRYPRMASRH